MTKLDDLIFLDATAQAELVRKKEIQAIELEDARPWAGRCPTLLEGSSNGA